jgi:hypothetical protein
MINVVKAHVTRMHAVITYRTMYTCTKCGVCQEGDKTTVETDNPQTIGSIADGVQVQSPSHMPIGWGRFDEGFRCPTCVGWPDRPHMQE